MVDIDKNELNKKRGLKIDLKIQENISIFLDKISSKLNTKIEKKDWLKKCEEWKKNYPIVNKKYFDEKNYVNPYVFIDNLSKKLKKNDIIVADDGGHFNLDTPSI